MLFHALQTLSFDRRALDIIDTIQLERWIDHWERQRRAKVIGREEFVIFSRLRAMLKDLHFMIVEIEGVEVDLQRRFFQLFEVDDLLDPGRVGAKTLAVPIQI